MTAALEQWSDKFSDLPLFGQVDHKSSGTRDDGLDVFKADVGYHVEIGRAVVVVSDYAGDTQIEVDYCLDGFRPRKIWYSLPMQQSDLQRDLEKVQWLTQRRMKDIASLYGAAIPSMFALYDVVKVDGPDKTYVGVDGQPMDKDAFDKRRKVLEKNLTEVVRNLHSKVGQPVREIEGTKLWMVIRANSKNPKYPWTNIHRQAPINAPIFKPAQYAQTTTTGIDEMGYDLTPF